MKNKKMGLYIHIPFCISKCNYCDFFSFPSDRETKRKYVDVLLEEIKQKSPFYKRSGVSSIYLGGGTPSSLDEGEIGRILEIISERFWLEEGTEISIEVNPGTLTREKAAEYKAAGINRISLGLQSAKEKELKLLGRIHTFGEFEESFSLAREAGFRNINVDLMSALPEQTTASWEHTLEKVLTLAPEHISAYSLIIEPGTPFYSLYNEDAEDREEGEQPKYLPDEETERQMYRRTKEKLEKSGYDRYEISNYAKKGFECRHNICYWKLGEYLGLGLGASSFIEGTRFHNTFEREEYFAHKFEKIVINEPDIKGQMEEFMFMGLRMTEGIHTGEFKERFGSDIFSVYGAVLERFFEIKMLERNGEYIRLSEQGIDVSSYLLAEFLFD